MWQDGADSKLFNSRKVFKVECYDIFASCRNRQFQNHIVFWVVKEWTPQVMDFVKVCNLAKIIKDVVNIPRTQADFIAPAICHVFIFEHEGDREINFKQTRINQLQKFVGSALFGLQTGNEDTGVNNDLPWLHGGIIYDTNPCVNSPFASFVDFQVK